MNFKNSLKLIALSLIVLFCSNGQSADSKFASNRLHQITLSGGWSGVSKDYGFGGNKAHMGFDLVLFLSEQWFVNLGFSNVAMGETLNTELIQDSFHISPGYRYKGLRTWAGLGLTTQAKEISSPNFFYVDPAPQIPSRVTVSDHFFSWLVAVAYDFPIASLSESYGWQLLLGPHLWLSDTFENNGFNPVVSSGLTLSLR